jgi:hypothetical protein
MLARCVACFKKSTYLSAEHIVFDTSPYAGETIGYIRNIVNACAKGELIAHADDDDIFHPRRLEEQVALLVASGKQCVGYRELLFWDTRLPRGEAWIYRNPDPRWAAGASWLYRRELWEQQPFEDAPHEDQRWWLTPLVSRNCIGISAAIGYIRNIANACAKGELIAWKTQIECLGEPRMICGIHGIPGIPGSGNTETYDRSVMSKETDVWRRSPEWDSYCARVMELK